MVICARINNFPQNMPSRKNMCCYYITFSMIGIDETYMLINSFLFYIINHWYFYIIGPLTLFLNARCSSGIRKGDLMSNYINDYENKPDDLFWLVCICLYTYKHFIFVYIIIIIYKGVIYSDIIHRLSQILWGNLT